MISKLHIVRIFRCFPKVNTNICKCITVQEYDATCLISKFNDVSATILIDQVLTGILLCHVFNSGTSSSDGKLQQETLSIYPLT